MNGTISGNARDYKPGMNRESSVNYPTGSNSMRPGGPIFKSGKEASYPNSNKSGIRSSINDGTSSTSGKKGKKYSPSKPYKKVSSKPPKKSKR